MKLTLLIIGLLCLNWIFAAFVVVLDGQKSDTEGLRCCNGIFLMLSIIQAAAICFYYALK